MSQIQQYQTQQQWQEWLANGKEVTCLMQIERSRHCPGDEIHWMTEQAKHIAS